jgi:VCBS repeat protein
MKKKSVAVIRAFCAIIFLTLAMMSGIAQSFAQNSTFTTQTYPIIGNTQFAGDFNGDGKPDLAGAGGNGVSVMLNNGDGTLRPKTDFPIPMQTQDVAAGDFNGDGKLDLAVTLYNQQFSLALLLGTGTGSFGAPTYFPNTSAADSPAVIATDLNNDGKLDVAIMHNFACFTAPCRGARTVTVMLGNGTGTFQPPREIDVNTFPHSMEIGDFNRDGIKDLAVGGENTELSILLGIGDGNFVLKPVMLLVPGGDLFSACNDVDVADFNRDGIQDITVPLGNGNGNVIALGNGDGTFRVTTRILTDAVSAPQGDAVADYNRDGFLDIARGMGDGTRGLLQILHGNGDGTFQPPINYAVPPPRSSVAGGYIISADFNGDAKPDIALEVRGAGPGTDVLLNASGPAVPPTSPILSTVTLNPSSVSGGSASTGTVTLSTRAEAPTTVRLASNSAAAGVPASVTVASGATTVNFSVSTTQVSSATTAQITATLNTISRVATLTISPTVPAADTISISRAEYDRSKTTLRVEASSTRATATLQVFITSTNQLLGNLTSNGGGKFSGQFSLPANPQNITIRSNFGGVKSSAVTLK